MKLLFLDLDGTLLDRSKHLPEENRQAISRARAQGHKVILCSGRPLCTIKSLVSTLELDGPGCYVISYNGGQIYDTHEQKTLYKATLTQEQVTYLFEEAHKDDIHVQTYDSQNLLVNERDRETEFYVNTTGISCRVVPNLPEQLEELPVKVLMTDLDTKERMDALRERITPTLSGKVDCFYSSDQFLEFVPAGVNKGAAVQWLSRYLGVTRENTYAVGDSENDIPMIQAVGHGFAMANATEAVKAVASSVTKRDCDHAGVAEIIEEFIINP